MNIGLFGGAFDPPHLGHLQVARALLQHHIVDEVWFLPVKSHHFEKRMSSVEDRVAMLELLIKDQQNMRIELYETRQEGVNYTYETMQALSALHPEHTFSFVMGSDNLSGFHRWLELHPMLLDLPFYIYPREGFSFDPMYKNMTPLEGVETVKVSSTEVREKVKREERITDFVLPEIEKYIEEQGLYH